MACTAIIVVFALIDRFESDTRTPDHLLQPVSVETNEVGGGHYLVQATSL